MGEREREKEKERERKRKRERERDKDRERESVGVCVCVCLNENRCYKIVSHFFKEIKMCALEEYQRKLFESAIPPLFQPAVFQLTSWSRDIERMGPQIQIFFR